MSTMPTMMPTNGNGPETLRRWIGRELCVPLEELRGDARFEQDLDIDVYTLYELVEALESEFGMTLPGGSVVAQTVDELIARITLALSEEPTAVEAFRHAS